MKRFLALMLALLLVLSATALGERTLSSGMSGEDVLEAQKTLEYYGYYAGELDGKYGSSMVSAVKKFQKNNGLKVDGKIGPDTLDKMNSSNVVYAGPGESSGSTGTRTTLSFGMSGDDVKAVQQKLRETYYYAGKIDGVYGSEVYHAVKEFQASTGLTVDGKVGPKTYDALMNGTASIFNGSIPKRTLESGCRGYDVYILQMKLYALNYLTIAPTGYYAGDTVSAVRAFQKANGIKEDGKVGPTVRRYLWPSTVQQNQDVANAGKGTVDDPYTERTLRSGSSGSDVASAQMYLKAGGYLLGKADGVFGASTKAAVKAFQKDYNLKVDGVIGSETWALLKTLNLSNAEQIVVDNNSPSIGARSNSLRKGNSGSQVKKLQQQLIQLGFLAVGQDDGKYGTRTVNAVRNFQKANGLKVDGVAGTQTFVCLNEQLGVQWDVPVG